MLGGKMVIENGGFKDKKQGGRPQVLNKTAIIAVKKARYKRGNLAR